MSNEKLVRKTLRTLPKRFAHKVTAIEEAQNLTTMMVECPNYIKKQSKNYYSTLTDDDSKVEDEQEEQVNNFVAFTRQIEPTIDDNLEDNSEDEEDITEEELLEDYKLLYTKWTELTITYTKIEVERCKLKKENEKLTKIVMDRDEEIKNLNAQLKYLNKGAQIFLRKLWWLLRMLVTIHERRDEVRANWWKPTVNNIWNHWWLHEEEQHNIVLSLLCHVTYTTMKATSQSSWYMDSGCSQHKIGKKIYLAQIQPLKGDHATFGDGGRAKIVGKGQLRAQGLLHLDGVLLVEGLTANLIRISQLCDHGMKEQQRTIVVMESVNVKVLDQGLETCKEDANVGTTVTNSRTKGTCKVTNSAPGDDNSCDDICSIQPASRTTSKIQTNHSVDNIIGQLDQGITTRRKEPVDYRKMIELIGKDTMGKKKATEASGDPCRDDEPPVVGVEAQNLNGQRKSKDKGGKGEGSKTTTTTRRRRVEEPMFNPTPIRSIPPLDFRKGAEEVAMAMMHVVAEPQRLNHDCSGLLPVAASWRPPFLPLLGGVADSHDQPLVIFFFTFIKD
ncbi:hypothetical protein LIER_27623 [Lithospermum erythrorhizon]|uniref:Retrovirus-related Pol polyprotein from transposon TNT 1-94-like beta-barrel domain-containing protein n=1 Tax=Lithospermum erythrorhizon TaxID=34254 RepID=A0AAV3RE88_LITER